MHDMTVLVGNDKGAAPEVWRTLGDAGVNVEAGASFFREGHRVVHVAVEDPVAAIQALRAAGHLVADAREVLALPIDDRPGAAAELTQKLVDAGVTVLAMYMGTNNRLVLAVDDLEAARGAVA